MPDDLVHEALGASRQQLFSFEGWLHFRRICEEDIEPPVLAAFKQFGSNAIGDAFERGSAKVN